MAGDARLTALETPVLGRAAMGESLRTGSLGDQWRIRRDGRLVHAEALWPRGDLEGAAAAATARDAVLILRFLAIGHAPLRSALIRFLMAFRAAPLPGVWSV